MKVPDLDFIRHIGRLVLGSGRVTSPGYRQIQRMSIAAVSVAAVSVAAVSVALVSGVES